MPPRTQRGPAARDGEYLDIGAIPVAVQCPRDSPAGILPVSIRQLKTIKTLIDAGVLVICVGGGGIPITENENGVRKGAEAVIDKDLATALLAKQIDADLLMLLTDVENVQMDWGTPDARPIRSITVEALRQTSFAAGSMGPKVEAACRFVEATGRRAAIGSLSQAPELVRGDRGTQVWHSPKPSH